MTIVSSKEFIDNMFVIQNFVPNDEPEKIFEPDDDFYRSITADELLDGIYEDIDVFFANK